MRTFSKQSKLSFSYVQTFSLCRRKTNSGLYITVKKFITQVQEGAHSVTPFYVVLILKFMPITRLNLVLVFRGYLAYGRSFRF